MTLSLSCKEEEISESIVDDKYTIYYSINNKTAKERLDSIMYNLDAPQHPLERFKIIHISDPHLSEWSSDNHFQNPNNLKEAVMFANQKDLKINMLVATGDFIGNYQKTNKKEAFNYLNSFIHYFYQANQIPSFLCLGNHDTNMLSYHVNNHISKKEIYDILKQAPNYIIFRPEGENYYYTDIIGPEQNYIRLISLDMTDQDSFIYDVQHDAIFSQKQIDWLCNIALQKNMTNRHSVIILNHYPFQYYSKSGNTFLCDGDFVHSWHMIPEIIEAFRKKEQIENVYENKYHANSPIHVKADFQTVPGEFICYLGGHAHLTTQFEIEGLANQSSILPRQNMLLCTNQSPSEVGIMYNNVLREKQSIYSNSFCIDAMDIKQRKIYITFFGAYKPINTEQYSLIQEISY